MKLKRMLKSISSSKVMYMNHRWWGRINHETMGNESQRTIPIVSTNKNLKKALSHCARIYVFMWWVWDWKNPQVAYFPVRKWSKDGRKCKPLMEVYDLCEISHAQEIHKMRSEKRNKLSRQWRQQIMSPIIGTNPDVYSELDQWVVHCGKSNFDS